MAKYTLENNFEFDFVLFSIVCHESEYRLCSALKKTLGIDLARDKGLELKNKKQKDILHFSFFSFTDEKKMLEFFLLNNLRSNAAKTEEKTTTAM
ncbi:MAG: IPExxxVDY family protein, partial [Bacteroidia bacterium]|nr:IPExxxVDY family protein [Bacteroidia bacterium]